MENLNDINLPIFDNFYINMNEKIIDNIIDKNLLKSVRNYKKYDYINNMYNTMGLIFDKNTFIKRKFYIYDSEKENTGKTIYELLNTAFEPKITTIDNTKNEKCLFESKYNGIIPKIVHIIDGVNIAYYIHSKLNKSFNYDNFFCDLTNVKNNDNNYDNIHNLLKNNKFISNCKKISFDDYATFEQINIFVHFVSINNKHAIHCFENHDDFIGYYYDYGNGNISIGLTDPNYMREMKNVRMLNSNIDAQNRRNAENINNQQYNYTMHMEVQLWEF